MKVYIITSKQQVIFVGANTEVTVAYAEKLMQEEYAKTETPEYYTYHRKTSRKALISDLEAGCLGFVTVHIPTTHIWEEDRSQVLAITPETLEGEESPKMKCNNCGQILRLDNLHKRSLPTPKEGKFHVVCAACAGAEKQWGRDAEKTWIIEEA